MSDALFVSLKLCTRSVADDWKTMPTVVKLVEPFSIFGTELPPFAGSVAEPACVSTREIDPFVLSHRKMSECPRVSLFRSKLEAYDWNTTHRPFPEISGAR